MQNYVSMCHHVGGSRNWLMNDWVTNVCTVAKSFQGGACAVWLKPIYTLFIQLCVVISACNAVDTFHHHAYMYVTLLRLHLSKRSKLMNFLSTTYDLFTCLGHCTE